MPTLPLDSLPVPLDGGPLPVASIADVQNEFAGEVQDPPVAPVRDALQLGIKGMLQRYQRASRYAAAQSDPARATGVYLDEIGSYERDVHRQAGELDASYRARVNAFEGVADPGDIVAAANAVLAPYSSGIAAGTLSCVYFERNDCWFARSGPFYDIVGASNASPVKITARYPLDPSLKNGATVTVAHVAGNAGANGTFPIALVAGPLQILDPGGIVNPAITLSGTPASAFALNLIITRAGGFGVGQFSYQVATSSSGLGPFLGPFTIQAAVTLGATGLTVHFAPGTYNHGFLFNPFYLSVCTEFTLDGSTGTGAYAGGGSFSDASDLAPWSSHVFSPLLLTNVSGGAGTSTAGFRCPVLPPHPDETPNYPDRLYSDIRTRRPFGARAFTNQYGRVFWLLVPDISGLDENVTAVTGVFLDIVGASNTTPIEIRTRFPLPADLVTGSAVTIAGVLGNAAANRTWQITVTGPDRFTLDTSSGNGDFLAQLAITDATNASPIQITTQAPLPASLTTGAQIAIAGVTGNTAANCPATGSPPHMVLWTVTVTGTNTLTLDGSTGSGAYTGGGEIVGGGSVQYLPNPPLDGFYLCDGSADDEHAQYLWNVGATSFDIYNAVVSAVQPLVGQSVRWELFAEPKLGA